MKRYFLVPLLSVLASLCLASMANDFGPADFPGNVEIGMPQSFHDAWCRQLNRDCRVRFSGREMTVDGFKGITREQLIGFRSDSDGNEKYFYVRYTNGEAKETTALFMFVNKGASAEFGKALVRWYEQDPKPYPNYRYPNSQGPQDTQGR